MTVEAAFPFSDSFSCSEFNLRAKFLAGANSLHLYWAKSMHRFNICCSSVAFFLAYSGNFFIWDSVGVFVIHCFTLVFTCWNSAAKKCFLKVIII